MILKNGKVKGNCDAELILQAMIDIDKYEKAVLVSSDGDFACLIAGFAQIVHRFRSKSSTVTEQIIHPGILRCKG